MIDAERMHLMNWSVDQELRSTEVVAAEFLADRAADSAPR